MEEYKLRDTTHLLICHYGNRFGKRKYFMNCLPLKETENGKIKVLIFGKRSNCRAEVSKIQYVDKGRVISKQTKLFI